MISAELALRLRYEIRRESAPYVSVAYERRCRDNADIAIDEQEADSGLSVLASVRFWFWF